MKKLSIISLAVAAVISTQANADCITKADVEAAQKAWGDGIVKIGKSSNPKEAAIKHLEKFYGYGYSPVLFKPTLASVDQFRGTKKEALSYFIGQDYKEDKGFALAPYVDVRWESEGINTYCGNAMSMGNYYFKKPNGKEVKAEYSLGWVKYDNGEIKITLHHSSLPFVPK